MTIDTPLGGGSRPCRGQPYDPLSRSQRVYASAVPGFARAPLRHVLDATRQV